MSRIVGGLRLLGLALEQQGFLTFQAAFFVTLLYFQYGRQLQQHIIEIRNTLSMYKEKKQLTAKIVIIGDVGVGKSSITIRYVYDKFDLKQQSTLGAAYLQKQTSFFYQDPYSNRTRKNSKDETSEQDNKLNQHSLKLQIWDTAGQEKYKAIAKLYYRDCRVAILVYDVTRRQTFENLHRWHDQLIRHAPKNTFLLVVANKIDMIDTLINQSYVTNFEGEVFAGSINAKFVVSSAKNKKGIDQMFKMISETVGPIIYRQKKEAKNQTVSSCILEAQNEKKRKKCCN